MLNRRSIKPRIRSRINSQSRAAKLEPLESRKLLAAAINGGTLIVDGTTNADTIALNLAAGGNVNVIINGATQTFSLAAFNGILVNANNGADKVTLSSGITKPSTIKGGAGNDSLVGGGGKDVIDGGTGGDTIKGGGGTDTADYSARTANLTIGVGSLSDDGEAGEKDNVSVDIETILGGSGNDTIKGGDANNLLVGNGGNDSLAGNYGNDTLSGNAGTDTLNGEGGTDTATNAVGDTLISIEVGGNGGGENQAFVSNRVLYVNGSSGDDHFGIGKGPADNLVAVFGQYFDLSTFDSIHVRTLAGNDDLSIYYLPPSSILVDLGDGNDGVHVFGNSPSVIGGNGNDAVVLYESATLASFDGGAGIDSINIADGNYNFSGIIDLTQMPTVENVLIDSYVALVIGNNLDNDITVAYRDATLKGNGGNDRLEVFEGGGSANTLIEGGEGNDTIYGSESGPDTLDGGNGNDVINGGSSWFFYGNDLIRGGAGNDLLFGSAGNDTLEGGSGSDTLDGGQGSDLLKGGEGNDTVDYSGRSNPVYVGIGTLADDGEAGEKDNVYLDIETVLGGSGNDTLKGGDATNLLVGNGGNDALFGNYGNDTLSGNAGLDTLNGEGGSDTATNSAGDILLSIEAIG